MDYELDFDTSLLDYHASKVDDLPYLDLFHDDKLDFGEDRQDCADLADAASPTDMISDLFDPITSGPEADAEDTDSKKEEKDAGMTSTETSVKDDKQSKSQNKTSDAHKEKAEERSEAPQEKEGEEPEAKRPRRSSRQYNLRQTSIINRIETEVRRAKPREPKPKSKPPPLSKYRRRTANSRERTRMAEINDAFEVLQKAIPHFPTEESSKLTKITTLRLALNYIGELREMLGYTQPASPSTSSHAPAAATASTSKSCASSSAASKASPKSTKNPRTPKNSKAASATVSASVSATMSAAMSATLSATMSATMSGACPGDVACSPDVTMTKNNVSVPLSADPALSSVNTDPFTGFNLAALSFPSTVPSPGSVSTIPSPDNLSCINTNMGCLSPGTMQCLSPDSMSCVSPSLSMTCSSPGSSISDNAHYYGMPYMGLSNPLDSEGESVTSLS